MLSVIIPSHNDIYLHKTIDSLLSNALGEIEIIPVLDGYDPETPITNDLRVFPVYHSKNRGMREAINTGVRHARYPYLMRSDEHCTFGFGFDKIILNNIEDNWIVVHRRYFLDPVKWKVMGKAPVDYEKLIIKVNEARKVRKFSSCPWSSRTIERAHIDIDETMAFQGSCWIMSRSWWNEVIIHLQTEGYGTLYQDTTEMLFKTWRAGGKLMLNKRTWYAHKHRDFNRTHDYPAELSRASWAYALKMWEEDYLKVKEQWGI